MTTLEDVWSRLNNGTPGNTEFSGGFEMRNGQPCISENMWIQEANFEIQRGRQQTSLSRGRGIDTVFLLDCSQSMHGRGLELLKETFMSILCSMRDNSQHTSEENVAIVTFGEETKVVCHLTNEYDKVVNCLDSIKVGGRSPLLGGLYMALAAVMARGAETMVNGYTLYPRIVLLSDGKATDSEACSGPDVPDTTDSHKESLLNLATRFDAENYEIVCVPIGDADETFLQNLATISSGRLVPPDSAFRIGRHFKNLTTLTKVGRMMSLAVDDKDHFTRTVANIDPDTIDSDIDDMLSILQKTNNLAKIKADDEIIDPNMPLLGTRVKRGPNWRYGDQDGRGPGTIVKHTAHIGVVVVEWDNNHKLGLYRYGADNSFDLEITRQPRILKDGDKIIDVGCLVCRGDDWDHGNQDGGNGVIGVVFNVSAQGVVRVRWPNGHINIYRYGLNGMFDLQLWEPQVPEEAEHLQWQDIQQPAQSNPDETHTEVADFKFSLSSSSVDDVNDNDLFQEGPDTLLQSIRSDISDSYSELSESSASYSRESSKQSISSADVIWQYKRKGGEWTSYSAPFTKKIERAYAQNKSTVVVLLENTNYRILNLKKPPDQWKQVNTGGNKEDLSQVRRIEIPREIKEMDQTEIDLYFASVEGGTEKSRNLRLMVVGHEGVGKTTTCYHLLQKGNVKDIQSTNGIDIFIHRYEVNLKTQQRKELSKSEEVVLERITRVMAQYRDQKEDEQAVDDLEEEETQVIGASSAADDHAAPRHVEAPLDECHGNLKGTLHKSPYSPHKNYISKFINLKSNKWNDLSNEASNTDDQESKFRAYEFLNDVKDVIRRLPLECVQEEEGEQAYLSVWDFGGEDVYYDTHHIFLSTDAVYLVVFNIPDCRDNREKFERVHFWLRSIGTLGTQEGENKELPPIILVGTHVDKLGGSEEEKKNIFTQLCIELLEHQDLQEVKNYIQGYCFVDNTNPHHLGFSELWKTIIGAAPQQSQWNKELPAKWIALERDLLKLKASKQNIMTFADVMKQDKKSETPIKSEKEIEVFLRYLHLTGNILYFQDHDDPQKGKVILNPQWIVHAFRCLITAPKFVDFKSNNLDTLWRMYNLNAELTLPLVEALWREDQFVEHKATLLKLMEKMGLIARPVRLKTTVKEQLKYYIVPTLLKACESDWLEEILKGEDTISSKTLCFVYNFIPFTVFHKLTAVCIANYKIAKEQLGNNCLQKGFGCFMVDSFWYMALSFKHSVIRVTMFKFQDENSPIPDEAFVKARKFLEEALDKIFQLHHLKNVKAHYCIQCSFQCKEDQNLKHVHDLHCSGKIMCCKSPKTRFLTKKDLDPWFTKAEQQNDE